MNKSELVETVAADLGISKAMGEKAVNSVLSAIKKGTKKGVRIIGFGSFSVVKRKPRMSRNPKTGEPVKVPASRAVKFRAGKEYKESI